ncbi:disease resistance protein RPP5 isoform X3 [Cajanus cajan]|uniref:disease resistance protein RPP5 isoform X3 n=1 Tax=Cajanus cajan TaxID=3821 RepID=UPI00098DA873|nr:disease resistance protein RPP5 isoform X3 [Cajanus cajan]
MAVRSCLDALAYDVFLNFRGSDTRHGFTGNLYKALHDRGIHTFIDDEELQRGEEITPALQSAIEKSKIAIIVLSNNYASSSFCLDELTYIVECLNRKDLLVLPVFYNVDPSDVRYQKSSYGEALAKHEERFEHNMEKLQKWKMALHQVANLSGFHFKYGDGYEYQFIERIVELVSSKINRASLPIADYPVGLDSQVLEVKKLLAVEFDNSVHMIGIHGIGGIGKSTLARAVYNSIADDFDGSCFLENVREKSNKHGLKHLQSILVSEILRDKKINSASVEKITSMMQHRLQQKKVLLILDDVDNHQQLEAFKPYWFGPGSRVIITTRDKQLLASHEVKTTYEVKELNKNNALQLLTWKGFKTEIVDPSYEEVLNCVVTYASGLPLALEIIGSNLFGKSIKEWRSAINQYKRIPNNQILEKLKVSFDALEEEEKSVFLDIACCFKEYKLTEVEDILRALYGDCMKYHVGVLIEKSLIKVSQYGTIKLHDLIQDMGREIDRKESPKEPGKHRRLWLWKDIIQVLKDNTKFVSLSVLNFDWCKHLTRIPDLYGLPNLSELSFQRCQNLITVHNSIGFLHKLKTLSAVGCRKLRSFPPIKLTSLEKLELSFCSSLGNFPEILGKMENMRELNLLHTPIKELPLSFQNLIGLRGLCMTNNEIVRLPSSIVMMPELTTISASGLKGWQWLEQEEGEEKVGSIVSSKVEYLRASKCNLDDDFFSIGFTRLAYVNQLDLSNNNFTVIPECIKQCQLLQRLDVRNCKHLREIRGIPPNLKYFLATNCVSLTSSSISMFLYQKLHEAGNTLFHLRGGRITERFDHQSNGPSISLWFRNKVLCHDIAPCDNYTTVFSPIVLINGNQYSFAFELCFSIVNGKGNETYILF